MKPMNRLQSRQENQNRRRLKAAGFPYLKTMEEFDCSQLNDAVSPVFLNELASCQFISGRQNVVMIGNPGRGKTHLSIGQQVHLAGGDNLVSRDVRHNVRLLVRHEKSASKNACAFCHIFTFSSYALALWR